MEKSIMKKNTAVVVQCRLSSSRLPQKALKDLGGSPVLSWVLRAMKKVKADLYILATDPASYEELKDICQTEGYICFSGDLNDVLKRFCDVIQKYEISTVVRATADNPYLFYEAANDSLLMFEEKNKEGKCDYLTLTGLPHGSGVEVFSADSLLKARDLTDLPYDHEHVGPALYNHKENFNCEFIPSDKKYNYPSLRTTIDTYSDYLRALKIYDFLGPQDQSYSCAQIISACQSKSVEKPVILMPSVLKGRGTGHLYRCLDIALKNNYFVYIPQNKTLEECDSIVEEFISRGLKKTQIISALPDESYRPVIIADTFSLTKKEKEDLSFAETLILIDDNSPYIDSADYILNIIPSILDNDYANCVDSSLILKPENIRKESFNIKNTDQGSALKILICFGGEDPSNLSLRTLKSLSNIYKNAEYTVVSKKLKKEDCPACPKLSIFEKIPDLRNELYKFDLLFTHYGLTAYEALYSGLGVVLLPTTKLHLQLAQKYNFAFSKDCAEENIRNALKSPFLTTEKPVAADENSSGENTAGENTAGENSSGENNIYSLLNKIAGGEKITCPVCQCRKEKNEAEDILIARNHNKTYRRCSKCGMIYLSWSCEEEKKYVKSYFFDEYQKQYGKTYTEDFASIKKQCFKRLDVLKKLESSLNNKTSLDIGCAYGPFLSAASDYKMKAYGTDISDDAIAYVNNELKLKACVSSFPDFDSQKEFNIEKFDIVSMWYVIEHFKNLDAVLEKVSSLVKNKGFFAFSTPSAQGVSAKSNRENFFLQSPSDHCSVWEYSKADKILRKYGFRVKKIVSTGHHPERFPSMRKKILEGKKISSKSLHWKFLLLISKIFRLGDTVEIYCKKIEK
jgi:spore coat polysaccharide biosynthesis protein SpsF (cytidylyltransferase family)/2-polyprenyl-3-methyl-5-hydroxy-6-metoxy-1,4-benzoquinol methylase